MILSGCGLTPSKENREWISVSCSGFAHWNKCHEEARHLCAKGYDIANQEENLITQGRTMDISCK